MAEYAVVDNVYSAFFCFAAKLAEILLVTEYGIYFFIITGVIAVI